MTRATQVAGPLWSQFSHASRAEGGFVEAHRSTNLAPTHASCFSEWLLSLLQSLLTVPPPNHQPLLAFPAMGVLVYALEMSVSKPFTVLLQILSLHVSPLTLQQPPLTLREICGVFVSVSARGPPPAPSFLINDAESRCPGLSQLVSVTAASGPVGCRWGWEPVCMGVRENTEPGSLSPAFFCQQ